MEKTRIFLIGLKFLESCVDTYNMEKNVIKIENWALIFTQPDPYTAPECCPSRLTGNVFGHPDFEDGTFVSTSTILEASGNLVKTKNNTYLLVNPCEKYVKWCQEKGYALNPSKVFQE